MLDLVIRGAHVVDGTGKAGKSADVGVHEGMIVEIGRSSSRAREVVDASGLILAPGFIDVHTHYDAQVFWDPGLSPSPQHGVTTVISGNCGFTLAPLSPSDASYLAQMLARVEGMPLQALESGLDWSWRSVGDYVADVESRGVAVNVAFLAGHSTIRRHVMGERSGERPDLDDIAGMVHALRRAIEQGAIGFSTSDSATHTDEMRSPVPSRLADDRELLALASELRSHPGTILQCVPPSGPYSEEVKDRLVALSIAADRPINWNVVVVNSSSRPVAENRLEASDRARKVGACVTGLVFPTLNRLRISFKTGFFIDTLPGWAELFQMPHAERLLSLSDAAYRAMLREGSKRVRPDQSFITKWSDYEVTDVDFDVSFSDIGKSIGQLAAERGCDPFDALLDVVIQTRLGVGLTLPADADDDAGWQLRGELSADPRTVVGGSDAGAHLDMMCGATYTTSMLAEFPTRGLMSLEEVVRQLTDTPARLYGLRGLGRIELGYKADLVMFDPAAVHPSPLEARRDLPGDSARIFAGSNGIGGVWVNGVRIVTDGALNDSRPGHVLRSGIDTDTVNNATGLSLTSK